MSVLIKDLKKPENCDFCPIFLVFTTCGCDRDHCMFQEVPEPHGRLIDADKIGLTDFEIILCQKGNPFKNALEMLFEKIEAAPTVIPASEEE